MESWLPGILSRSLKRFCQDTEAIGKTAADKLIDLVEHPKTALIDRYVMREHFFRGASVKKYQSVISAIKRR